MLVWDVSPHPIGEHQYLIRNRTLQQVFKLAKNVAPHTAYIMARFGHPSSNAASRQVVLLFWYRLAGSILLMYDVHPNHTKRSAQ